ncbi:MAG: hypothetical protein HC898_04190 [Phycisphaerales bacterium]|nr:hypothetical protein [Phycisphaerales bacterium]
MKTLREIANNYETRPESAGLELRLNLAEIVLVEMDRRGWNQKQLAEACGMKPAFIHRIITATPIARLRWRDESFSPWE